MKEIVKIGFYTLDDIQVNTILCGKHGWSANAFDSGSEWTNKPRYRVSAVIPNNLIIIQDSYLGGKEEIIHINSLNKKQEFASQFRVVKIKGDVEDFIFNSKCSVYRISTGTNTWVSRNECSFTYKSSYEVCFSYKGYGFKLFRMPKLDKEREAKFAFNPVKTEKINSKSSFDPKEFEWYFGHNQTFENNIPWKCPEKIQKRALKFMFFIWNHFKDGYANKLHEFQMKQPIILVANK